MIRLKSNNTTDRHSYFIKLIATSGKVPVKAVQRNYLYCAKLCEFHLLWLHMTIKVSTKNFLSIQLSSTGCLQTVCSMKKKLSAPNKLVTIETMIYLSVKEVKVKNNNKCKIKFNTSVSPQYLRASQQCSPSQALTIIVKSSLNTKSINNHRQR